MATPTYLEFDPDGYSYAEEPGFEWETTLRQFYADYIAKDAAGKVQACGLWQPPGVDWVMTQPNQLLPDWKRSLALADHTIRDAGWTYAAEVTHREYDGELDMPGSSSTLPIYWAEVPELPDTWTDLGLGLSMSDLWTAAALSDDAMPTGLAPFCSTSTLPGLGADSVLSVDCTPYLEVQFGPHPQDLFLFGFHDIAVVMRLGLVVVLRQVSGTWSQLARISVPGFTQGASSMVGSGHWQETTRVAFVPVAGEWLYVIVGDQETTVRTRTLTGGDAPSDQFVRGPWWAAGCPGQIMAWHTEVVGYRAGTYPPDAAIVEEGGTPAAGARISFDLGYDYLPTVDPQIGSLVTAQYAPDATITWTDLPGFGKRAQAATTTDYTGAKIEYQLVDETGAPWVSGGTHSSGGFILALTPTEFNSVDASAIRHYASSGIKKLSLRFDPLLTPRANAPYILADHYFHCQAESSLLEADGKRLDVTLTPSGAALAGPLGYLDRAYYPIHWFRYDGLGAKEIIAAGWVEGVEHTDERAEMPALAGVRGARLTCKGLLNRLKSKWLYLPRLIPETDGTLTHIDAVRRVLKQRAFDPDDTAQVQIYTDPAPADVQSLPGLWTKQPLTAGMQSSQPYSPDWDKTPLEYLNSIAREWRGWLLYEDLPGVLHYHPDLRLAGQIGETYYVACVLYRSRAEAAVNTTIGDPLLWYTAAMQRQYTRPQANAVRVTGVSSDGAAPVHVLWKDLDSISNLSAPLGNYLGEVVVDNLHTKLAVTEECARQLALWRLYDLRLPGDMEFPRVVGPLPRDWKPAPVDVGACVTLYGLGDYRVMSLSTRRLSGAGDDYETTLVCQRLPPQASASLTAGSYPGQGGS